MLNPLHFIRGFTKLLQQGIWFLNEGRNCWDTPHAFQSLCMSQRSHHLPRMLHSSKLQAFIIYSLGLTGGFIFFLEEILRVRAAKSSVERGWLILLSNLITFSILLLSVLPDFSPVQKSMRCLFHWHVSKQKHPSIIWSRQIFSTQNAHYTWRLCCRPLQSGHWQFWWLGWVWAKPTGEKHSFASYTPNYSFITKERKTRLSKCESSMIFRALANTFLPVSSNARCASWNEKLLLINN